MFVGTLPGFSPNGIAVDDLSIYLTNGNEILRMPIGGGTPTPFISDPRFGTLGQLALVGTDLYALDGDSSTGVRLWRVAVPEPSSLALVGVGGLALVRRGWRKRGGTARPS